MEEQNTSPQTEVVTQPVVALDAAVSTAKFGWKSFAANNFLALSILVAGGMISGSLFYTKSATVGPGTAQIQQDGEGNVKADVSVDDDPMLGDKKAQVTIIEFSDYQCPFCRVFWKNTFGQIKKEYVDTGKARFIYRDYPLSFHPMAHLTAEAAECADDQGKYWEMHDKIFGEEEKLGQGTVTYTSSDLKKWAAAIGLDLSKFNQCLDSGKYKAEVDKDFTDGTAAGVSGTPSVFINGRLIVGAQPFSAFKAIIDEELTKK